MFSSRIIGKWFWIHYLVLDFSIDNFPIKAVDDFSVNLANQGVKDDDSEAEKDDVHVPYVQELIVRRDDRLLACLNQWK